MGRPESRLTTARPVLPAGGFVRFDGDDHYRIAAYHRMDPFLVSLPSDTDLWMFVASGGGLTAGRRNADGALFPYRTVDQLHDAHHHTGPVTLVRVEDTSGMLHLWEPFGDLASDSKKIERNLYKNALGNRLVFEEIHHGLELSFRYAWEGCDRYGWVRTAHLGNRATEPRRVEILDGLLNIIPYGAPLSLYQQASNLVNAYKKTEVDSRTGLGIFSLTAGITDRAEAVEVLRANVVWCQGLEGHRTHLSSRAVDAFRAGRVVAGEEVLNGARGNYLVTSAVDLEPCGETRWRMVADTGLSQVRISALRKRLAEGAVTDADIDEELAEARTSLRRIVASADGLQLTGRTETSAHHFANVLFNSMRGGVFDRNSDVPVADLTDFLAVRDRAVAERVKSRLQGLPARIPVADLRALAHATGDADFERLCHEYLPLYFGRRHGDPSRPWNQFEIHVRDRDGNRALHYAGNWRDIFQNWEALCLSFPMFLPNVVAKFVNASTVDGYNPYRITRDGIDWEVVNEEDPWSNIGYWGDHQIVYLLKLLEALDDHDPETLTQMLEHEIFSYADVPYRIKGYRDLVEDPRETIVYDTAHAQEVEERVAARGTDGRLVPNGDGRSYHANLFEKLLVPAMAKLSNLVPDAGIWMNTQRPEWNDANNALGGGGVSMVTLCYLRRYLDFLAGVLERRQTPNLPVSREIVDWFDGIAAVLKEFRPNVGLETFDSGDRKRMMDRLGENYARYREQVYENGFSDRTHLPLARVKEMCRTALSYLDREIAANRRDDGLYHTYNLLEFAEDGSTVDVGRLQVMLEGQVAVLSSGCLEPADALELFERLFASDLYRADQKSFLLYPERTLPGFMERNIASAEDVAGIALLEDLLADDDASVVDRDADGAVRFHGDLGNARDLAAALDRLAADPRRTEAVGRDRQAVLDLFEKVFAHDSYTGRSGVMYGYEGLGCIYWHMVAKLMLAAQEVHRRAVAEQAPAKLCDALADMYRRIRAGIGYQRSVEDYGAFPMDPYSHTPPDGGAKQPGMTGQVKEEIITRLGELGVSVGTGSVAFHPTMLDETEFLSAAAEFRYFDVTGTLRSVSVPEGGLAFTYCQVPVIYERTADQIWIRVGYSDGTTSDVVGDRIDQRLGRELHARTGWVDSIRVGIPDSALGLRP